MISFKQFIVESYKNLFSEADKRKYAEEAYAQLISSYKKVGGIHGSGFNDVEDFIKNIPFWKLQVKDGKILAAAYYKDKQGRKRVAVSSDGSKEGKRAIADMIISDIVQERAYVEQSGPSLALLAKEIGYDMIAKYAIPKSKMEALLGEKIQDVPADDPEIRLHPQLKDYFYQRKIGNDYHTKIALGTPGKSYY